MLARVSVTLKSGVLDPQGKAIEGALRALGVEGIASVRQGKLFEIELGETDPARARALVEAACEKLLTNLVVEDYAIALEGREG